MCIYVQIVGVEVDLEKGWDEEVDVCGVGDVGSVELSLVSGLGLRGFSLV
jgi:hypothetical protein